MHFECSHIYDVDVHRPLRQWLFLPSMWASWSAAVVVRKESGLCAQHSNDHEEERIEYTWLIKPKLLALVPFMPCMVMWDVCQYVRGYFKNTYELLNLRALKFSPVDKIYIFQCMGKIFCVEFQRYPLKFHSKYFTHTLKDIDIIHRWKFKSS